MSEYPLKVEILNFFNNSRKLNFFKMAAKLRHKILRTRRSGNKIPKFLQGASTAELPAEVSRGS